MIASLMSPDPRLIVHPHRPRELATLQQQAAAQGRAFAADVIRAEIVGDAVRVDQIVYHRRGMARHAPTLRITEVPIPQGEGFIVRTVEIPLPAWITARPNALDVPLADDPPNVPPRRTPQRIKATDAAAVDAVFQRDIVSHLMHNPTYSGASVIREAPLAAPVPLHWARVIVAGGKGLGFSREAAPAGVDPFAWRLQTAFARWIIPLAAALGGNVAASRGAIDSGGLPLAYQVGQSGKSVAPDLYIAVGIRGAVQHLQGIAHAGTIIAIDADPDAPIFDTADVAIIGAAEQVLQRWLDLA
ncbi:MAG: electron transfer flavoprotein subunit alpha/FixB family protein [Phototrophicaceae bacterium]